MHLKIHFGTTLTESSSLNRTLNQNSKIKVSIVQLKKKIFKGNSLEQVDLWAEHSFCQELEVQICKVVTEFDPTQVLFVYFSSVHLRSLQFKFIPPTGGLSRIGYPIVPHSSSLKLQLNLT